MSASEAIKLAEANKELFTGQHGKEAYGKMMGDLKQHEKDGRAVDFSMTSSDGKTGSLTFGTQAGGNWSMHNASLKGWNETKEALNVSNWGSREEGGNKRNVTNTNFTGNRAADYDENLTIVDRGTKIGVETAYQAALTGDKALVKPMTNQFLSPKQREAEMAVLSRVLGKAASDYMQRQGVSADFAKGEAHLSASANKPGLIFQVSVGATGIVGGERTDRKTTDLMTQQYREVISSAYKEAQEKSLSVDETRNLVSSRIEDYTNAFDKEVRSRSPEKFGAGAPGQALTELGRKAADSGVPLPLASQPEQDRRLSELQRNLP